MYLVQSVWISNKPKHVPNLGLNASRFSLHWKINHRIINHQKFVVKWVWQVTISSQTNWTLGQKTTISSVWGTKKKKQLPFNSRISLEFFYKPQHLSPHVQLQRYSDVLFFSWEPVILLGLVIACIPLTDCSGNAHYIKSTVVSIWLLWRWAP